MSDVSPGSRDGGGRGEVGGCNRFPTPLPPHTHNAHVHLGARTARTATIVGSALPRHTPRRRHRMTTTSPTSLLGTNPTVTAMRRLALRVHRRLPPRRSTSRRRPRASCSTSPQNQVIEINPRRRRLTTNSPPLPSPSPRRRRLTTYSPPLPSPSPRRRRLTTNSPPLPSPSPRRRRLTTNSPPLSPPSPSFSSPHLRRRDASRRCRCARHGCAARQPSRVHPRRSSTQPTPSTGQSQSNRQRPVCSPSTPRSTRDAQCAFS
ncbi:hypothetical protein T492DRAFT_251823 [Pavlovales sp. CCMP2436]|nr:hypothetical protein T492DRAFT_251823 [Pavlovales sp. CCMP2436]